MTISLRQFEVAHSNGSFSLRPAGAGSHVRVLAASTAETHTVPTDSNTNLKANYVVFSATGDFWAMPVQTDEVDLVTNGTFATDSDWTKGAGWTIGSGVATATGAISTAISQTSDFTLIEGKSYSVTFTVSRTAGGIIPSIGGTAGTERTTSATFIETIIAGSTQAIAFTGNGFTGTIDTISITPVISVPSVDITAGGSPYLNPVTWTLSGDVSQILLISDSATVVNMQFFM